MLILCSLVTKVVVHHIKPQMNFVKETSVTSGISYWNVVGFFTAITCRALRQDQRVRRLSPRGPAARPLVTEHRSVNTRQMSTIDVAAELVSQDIATPPCHSRSQSALRESAVISNCLTLVTVPQAPTMFSRANEYK